MKSRVEEAVKTFETGYNCAQSIFATYADVYGIDSETALKLSSPLGAGIGRMREVCGVVSAMALLAGLKQGNTDPQNEAGKTEIYELVRKMSDKFKAEKGSIICKDLLGISEREPSAIPQKRTRNYYENRPCSQLVACAAKIVEEMLLEDIS